MTRLIQQISGSLELKQEYDELKELLEKATEVSSINYTKKRGINAEMKLFRQQKDDVVKYETLVEAQV